MPGIRGSGNLILPGEPLAIGYFVAPSKEKKMYKIKLKVKVKLINMIMQKCNENLRVIKIEDRILQSCGFTTIRTSK